MRFPSVIAQAAHVTRGGLAQQGVDVGAELFDEGNPAADLLLQIEAKGTAVCI